jgi:hypothetical protein
MPVLLKSEANNQKSYKSEERSGIADKESSFGVQTTVAFAVDLADEIMEWMAADLAE